MSEKLLPCPFCGSTYVEYVDAGQWKNIHCVSCGGDGAVDLGESGATESWNHRVYPPEVQAVIEAAKMWVERWQNSENVVNIKRIEENLLTAVRTLEESEPANGQ